MALPERTLAKDGRAAFLLWKPTLAAYSVIFFAVLFCHGFILSNDGTIWDSWYVLDWLKNGNWRTLHDFFDSVGIPLYGWLYRPFSWAADIIGTVMWGSFVLLLINSVLVYHLCLQLSCINRAEALMITTLGVTVPMYSAVQDLVMFFFHFTMALFLVGILLIERSMSSNSVRHWILRIASIVLILVSFSNAALVVFYGGVYLLLFFKFCRIHEQPLFKGFVRFIARFPDLFILPPAGWILRLVLTPQRGWYAQYNDPTGNLAKLGTNFASFFENVLPYHALSIAHWIADNPILVFVMVAGVVVAWRFLPTSCAIARSNVSSGGMAAMGAGLLLFAVLPFAAAGKYFPKDPTGEFSRLCILTNVPIALLIFATLRSLTFGRVRQSSVLLPALVAPLCFVLGAQIPPVYIRERAHWIVNRSLLHNATRDPACQASSIVIIPNSNITAQDVYGTYGFASVFGSLTRFVTHLRPVNGQFFNASEIGRNLLSTTLLPNEFNKVDPSGQQIVLHVVRNHDTDSDWDIVSRYRSIQSSGDTKLLDGFLTSLTTLKTGVLKSATSLGTAPPASLPPASSLDPNTPEFVNAVGMRMIRQSGGYWAAAHETSQQQYERLTGTNPSLFKDPNRPVERVSWNDAMNFCKLLNARESAAHRLPAGSEYRLPTSSEFESMARGTEPATGVLLVDQYRWSTEPVGSRGPNPQGLHDVLGNVWEWCMDSFDSSRTYRISRGGAWNSLPEDLLPFSGNREGMNVYAVAAASRLRGPIRWDYPDQAFWDRGFRCVLAPVLSPADTPVLNR